MALQPMTGQYGNGRVYSAAQAATAGRNTNSIMQGWVDRGPWIYYDSITILAATQMQQTYTPFSVPIGGQDPLTNLSKNKLQTNMVRGNQFPPPRCLLLGSIGIYFDMNWLKSDIDLIMTQYGMEFYIDEKRFHEGHLQLYPSGAGLSGLTTRNGESAYNNGLPAQGYARNYGDWAKYIAPEQQFNMNLQWYSSQIITSAIGTATTAPPTPTNGGVIRIYLNGLTDRSVQ
jgi:hypothetical protein